MEDSWDRFADAETTAHNAREWAKRIAAEATRHLNITASGVPFTSKDLNVGVRLQRESSSTISQSAPLSDTNARAEHFEEEMLRDAFEFVLLNVVIETYLADPLAWIRIGGIEGRKFFQHQLYGAFYLLFHERGPRAGAIVADLMGLGKTLTALLYIYFNFCLVEMHQDITRNPNQHCQPGERRAGGCPSQNKWPIVCYCDLDGVTRRRNLTPRPGASLIFVPYPLVSTWEKEWKLLRIRPNTINLYIHHSDSMGSPVPRGRARHLELREGANGGRYMPQTDSAHKYVILTTVESYHTQVSGYFDKAILVDSKRKLEWDRLAWARIIRDEAHLTTDPNTKFYKFIEGVSHAEWTLPNLLALTATPILRNGVTDMESIVKAINMLSPDIGNHSECTRFTSPNSIKDLQKKIDKIRKASHNFQQQQAGSSAPSGNGSQNMEDMAAEVGDIVCAYSLRRRNSTVQNGKLLAAIPPIEYYDVPCALPDEQHMVMVQEVEWLLRKRLTTKWQHEVGTWDEMKLDQAEEFADLELFLDNAKVPRILATLPSLIYHQPRRDWTWEHIQKQAWHEHPENSFINTEYESYLQKSAKLQKLDEILGRLDKDIDGEPEKIVVVSEFPIVCLAVLVVCRRRGLAATWMHADMHAKKREELAQQFQVGDLKRNGPTRPDDKPCRVLIGTSMILGQGITLNKAFRMVLMEPSRHAAVEAQIAKRIHRIGSRSDRCWFYRLYHTASASEGLLINGQNFERWYQIRAELSKAKKDVTPGLESALLPEPDFLLESASTDFVDM